jgi:hypothetical protein
MHGVSDLPTLGREAHSSGDPQGWAEHLCTRPALAVPTAGIDLQAVQGGAAGDRRGADRVACEEKAVISNLERAEMAHKIQPHEPARASLLTRTALLDVAILGRAAVFGKKARGNVGNLAKRRAG